MSATTTAPAKVEELYSAGRYAQAIELGRSILEAPRTRDDQAKTAFFVCMAYLQLGEQDCAKPYLRSAIAEFQALNNPEMLAECMGAEASVALLEQRSDAIALAQKALAACRSLPSIPPALELRILNGLAVTQTRFGQFEEAIETFEKAIELADPVVDMRRLGKLLDCAGIACRELGRMEQAVNYCGRAVALFETLTDLRSLAVAENDLGWALLGCGDLAGARRHLQRSLELHEQGNTMTDRSAVLSSLCELCLAEGELEQATRYANAALDFGERQSEAWSIADARMWKGRIALRLGDDARVDAEFHSALATLETSGMTMRLVQCHAEYAEVLRRRGNLPSALEHMKAALRIKTSGAIAGGAISVDEPVLLDVGAAVAETGPRIDPE